MKKLALSALAALASCAALAGPPTAPAITPGFSFTEYSGSQAVGEGLVDVPFTVFYIDEKVVGGTKSWYLFFDPGLRTQGVLATIHFDNPIAAVFTTRAELDASNAAYGSDSVTYGSSRFIGLEPCSVEHVFCDAVSWAPGAQDLKLDLSALDPGDHMRVLVAVPEPVSPLLFAVGLAGLALTVRRKRS